MLPWEVGSSRTKYRAGVWGTWSTPDWPCSWSFFFFNFMFYLPFFFSVGLMKTGRTKHKSGGLLHHHSQSTVTSLWTTHRQLNWAQGAKGPAVPSHEQSKHAHQGWVKEGMLWVVVWFPHTGWLVLKRWVWGLFDLKAIVWLKLETISSFSWVNKKSSDCN